MSVIPSGCSVWGTYKRSRILESFHSFTAAMAIYYDTVTKWEVAEANSYPISTNVLLETLITVLVQASSPTMDLPRLIISSIPCRASSASESTACPTNYRSLSLLLCSSWLDSLAAWVCQSRISWTSPRSLSMVQHW